MIFALAVAAWMGHVALMIAVHNWLYGQNLSKRVGDVVHLTAAIVVLAFPAALVGAFGWDLAGLLDWGGGPVRMAMQVYFAGCVVFALVWVPALTLYRNTRRDPATSINIEVVDVARQLGRRPVGDGHHAFLAKLPGNEIFQVEYVEKSLALPRLPAALDGLTVLHLSDLHLHGTPDRDFFRAVLDRCAAWHPDVLALTGDVVDSDTHHRWIIPLLGRLRWRVGAYAILGNHDHRRDVGLTRKRLRRLGMVVLENNWVEAEVRGEKVVVVGHEGPWLKGEPDLATCPGEPFRLCLSHTPDHVAWARRHGVDLMLAGHVHGGQIRVPPFGSLLVPSRLGRRHDMGTFHLPPTFLHVSRGLSGEHPVRYNCRPEATLLTLRRRG
jgi:predicted MPP superfamily phosphohydrolase